MLAIAFYLFLMAFLIHSSPSISFNANAACPNRVAKEWPPAEKEEGEEE